MKLILIYFVMVLILPINVKADCQASYYQAAKGPVIPTVPMASAILGIGVLGISIPILTLPLGIVVGVGSLGWAVVEFVSNDGNRSIVRILDGADIYLNHKTSPEENLNFYPLWKADEHPNLKKKELKKINKNISGHNRKIKKENAKLLSDYGHAKDSFNRFYEILKNSYENLDKLELALKISNDNKNSLYCTPEGKAKVLGVDDSSAKKEKLEGVVSFSKLSNYLVKFFKTGGTD